MVRWKRILIFVFLSSLLGMGLALTSAQGLTQQVLVQTAIATTQQLCANTGRDQACYGHSLVNAMTHPDVQAFTFAEMGDIENVVKLESLRLSDLVVDRGLWGITLMKLRANLATSVTDNVTLLAFGGVEMNTAESMANAAPMQAFYFQSDVETGSAAEVPTSGLLIQTPEGAGEVTFLMNEVNIQIGSTIYFEAAPGGDMIVSTLEGKARVWALGVEEVAVAGTRVRIPMTDDLKPAGPPTAPESYNAEALTHLPLSLLGRQIIVHPSGIPEDSTLVFQPVTTLPGVQENTANADLSVETDSNGNPIVTDANGNPVVIGPDGQVITAGELAASADDTSKFGCESGNSCNAPGHNKDGDKDASDANDSKDKTDKKDKKDKKTK